jgi:hypothetical protein
MTAANPIVNLLLFYGLFLITSGIASVLLIGTKAKTALLSGSTAGGLVVLMAFLLSRGVYSAAYAGLFLSFALFLVFSWRASLTLFRLFEMIATGHEELKGKGIAFLIIALMAVVSIVVFLLQVVFLLV